MKLLTTTVEINKAIESIAKRGQKLDADIHVAGVSVLKHVAEHGDTTLLDKLVLAMPKGSRKSAFCEWALAFGNVRMLDRSDSADAAAIEQGRLFAKDKTKQFDEVGAIAKKWYEFKPEPDLLQSFDAAAEVKRMMSRYTKAVKSNGDVVVTPESIAAMESLLQSLRTQMETM